MRAILGINFFHDSSAALVVDGELKAAVEQERLDRRKHSHGLPTDAINLCLNTAGIKGDQVTDVVCSWHPTLFALERLLSPFRRARNLKRIPWVFYQQCVGEMYRTKTRINGYARLVIPNARIHWIEHHLSHTCSTFLVSGFDEAATWSVDGRGEWSTSMASHAVGNKVTPFKRTFWPNSIGYYYNMFTNYLGFGADDEYKVMGLSGYGSPIYKDEISPILKYSQNDLFKFDTAYYKHEWLGDPLGDRVGNKVKDILGPQREPDSPMEERHMDIAASVQSVLTDVGVKVAERIQKTTGSKNLCLAGGVALNGVMNNAIRASGLFDNIFIQPAAGDSGCALGNAFWCENIFYGNPRRFSLEHVYLGSSFDDEYIKLELEKCQVMHKRLDDPAQTAAQFLTQGKIIGWYQGRSEFGPRALGNRSILADPRVAEAKEIVNSKIKFREEFRPFAPAVLADDAHDYFDLSGASKYMLMVCPVLPKKQSEIPSVTHIDGTARPQTVVREDNPMFWDLINNFKALTGTPVVLNTSFNVKDEPIVETPVDALRCFFSSGLDYLIMGSYLVSKAGIPADIA